MGQCPQAARVGQFGARRYRLQRRLRVIERHAAKHIFELSTVKRRTPRALTPTAAGAYPDGRMDACGCFIAPPDLLAFVAEHGSAEQRAAALRVAAGAAAYRSRRAALAAAPPEGPTPADGRRTIYDAAHGQSLPGAPLRGEGDPPVSDTAANQAYDGSGDTFTFYRAAYGRDSVDGHGMGLVSSVHYGIAYDNAFWDGSQMVYGDGSGQIFQIGALTAAVDVIGHELTHGVTEYTARLEYHTQPGALNESFSDVFGSLVKQRLLGQDAAAADWLIGAGTLVPSLGGALRSMKAPGTAWQGDSQPATMSGYRDLPDDGDPANDNGGVHLNSGIPNHAFYLAATAIGGYAWEKAGLVWYRTLTERLTPTADFRAAADATVAVAADVYGAGAERDAVEGAWRAVGVLP